MQITNGTKRWLALAIGGATLTTGGVALAATSSPTPTPAAPAAPSTTTPDVAVPNPADTTDVGGASEAADGTESSASEAADMAKLKALTKIDEAQAKSAALAKVPGTAGLAELSDENGKPVWDVEVTATNGTKQDVIVDAVTGTIVTAEAGD